MNITSMKANSTQYEVEFKFDYVTDKDENFKLTVFLKKEGSYDDWNLSFLKNEKIPLNALLKIIQTIFESQDFNIKNIFIDVIDGIKGIDGSIMIKKSDTNSYEDYADQLLKHFFAET